MTKESYVFTIISENEGAAGAAAAALADALRGAEGVIQTDRAKATDSASMDLGMIVSVLADSQATLAIAVGLAAWLRARRGVTVHLERHSKTASLKAAVSGIDPETAMRIVESVEGE